MMESTRKGKAMTIKEIADSVGVTVSHLAKISGYSRESLYNAINKGMESERMRRRLSIAIIKFAETEYEQSRIVNQTICEERMRVAKEIAPEGEQQWDR